MSIIITVIDESNKEKSYVCHSNKHTVKEVLVLLDELWDQKEEDNID